MNNLSSFDQDITDTNLVWIGEIHGIKENYAVYKHLINLYNFNQIALEYPTDLEFFTKSRFLKYRDYQDGRFSQESLDFFNWLKNKKIICFDNRAEKTDDLQKLETQMANILLSRLTNNKTLVISGNFHSQLKPHLISDTYITPAASIIKQKIKQMVTIGLKYSGGKFYNFGLKKIDRNLTNFDNKSLPFGKIVINDNPLTTDKWWFHVGIASPITLLE